MRENLLYKGEWNQCLLQCANAIIVFSNTLTLLNGIIDIFWWFGIGKGRTCGSFPSGEQFNISILLSAAAQVQLGAAAALGSRRPLLLRGCAVQ